MQKGKGFLRLVIALSILVYIPVCFVNFMDFLDEYYDKAYYAGLKGPTPHIKFVWQSMIIGAVYYAIPIWIIYGLTIFVIKGFMGKEKVG